MANLNGSVAVNELFTAAEVGERLRLPLSTVYYLAKAGKLRGFRVGRSWRFSAADVDRMQNTNEPRVLVVDDHEPIRRLVVLALTPRGCHVEEAGSVDEGLVLARHTKFDVLLVDLKMPGRDGTELLRELEGTYSLSQMVLISALPELAKADALAGLAGVTILPKPLSANDLAACVERVTGMRLRPTQQGSA